MNDINTGKRFELTAVIMLIFSITASALNYLFQIAAGRFLNTSDYGTLNSAFSFSSIVSVLGVALGMSIAKNLAENEGNVIGKLKRLFYMALCAFIPYNTVLICVMHFMNYGITTSVLASLSVFFLSVSYIFYGVLQGRQMFLNLSIFNLCQPVVKFIFGLAVLVLGLEYNVVFAVITVGCIVSMIYGYSIIKKNYSDEAKADVSEIKPIMKYYFVTVISTACLTFFNNIDVLLARQYFDENTVGLFSCSAVFGKIILYIPSVLVTMLYPIAAKEKGNKTVLYRTLIYSFIITFAASAMLFALKDFVIKLLMGLEYAPAAQYILPTVIYVIPLVLVTALVNYLIANGDKVFTNTVCVIAGAAIVILSFLSHKTIYSLLFGFAAVYVILFIILFIRSFKKFEG